MAVSGLEEKDDRIRRADAAPRRTPTVKASQAKRGHALLEASMGFLALLLIMIVALALRAVLEMAYVPH